MAQIREKLLRLPGGRTIAYEENGDSKSSTVVIFYHGVFGVGTASRPAGILLERGFHFLAPTLPGWGNTSPLPKSTSFSSGIISDLTALLEHLHPDDSNLKLYIGGGSFGTIPAQIIYGASYDIFPLGRRIAGLLLLAPFSPYRRHTRYAESMTWPNYLMTGPPSQWIPFHLLPRLAKVAFRRKLSTVEGASAFVRDTLFKDMKEPEREAFARWRDVYGVAEGQLERELGEMVYRSVATTWDGFFDLSTILHSDWGGFDLDEEHARRPILIMTSKGDEMAPSAMAEYLIGHYKNARLREVEGGHLAALFHIDELYKELLALSP